jgi:hypothetical protein
MNRAQLFGKIQGLRHIQFSTLYRPVRTYVYDLDMYMCEYMYTGRERGEMEPGPVTNLGPPSHSESHINI